MIRPCVRRACIAAVALTCLAGGAKAQSLRSAEADSLATQAHTLLEAGRIQEACARFAESARIEPHTATMLGLAECSEKSGRLADAAHYLRAAAGSMKGEAAQGALGHADVLESRLPRLAVALPAPVDGLEVRRDGVRVEPRDLGVAEPVDAGEHTISASAPGRLPWSTVVTTEKTNVTTVSVPELELAPLPIAASNGFLRPQVTTVFAFDAPKPAPRSTGVKIATLSLGLLGVASVGTSAFLGFRAKQISDAVDGRCNSQNGCAPNSSDLRSQASRDALASTVAFGAGAAAITAGALLWFLSPSKKRPKAALVPTVDFHRIAFTFSRAW